MEENHNLLEIKGIRNHKQKQERERLNPRIHNRAPVRTFTWEVGNARFSP